MSARTQHDRRAELHWLRDLRREAESQVEQRGGFRGRVRPAQRVASMALDVIEQAEQEVLAA